MFVSERERHAETQRQREIERETTSGEDGWERFPAVIDTSGSVRSNPGKDGYGRTLNSEEIAYEKI